MAYPYERQEPQTSVVLWPCALQRLVAAPIEAIERATWVDMARAALQRSAEIMATVQEEMA